MGVRLAVGVAQGLAYGIDCPVIEVSTLQALAQTAFAQTSAPFILAGWDARMGDVYWGAYAVDENKLMQSLSNDAIAKPDQILPVDDHPVLAAGNAWSVYQAQLNEKLTSAIQSTLDCYPDAKAMLPIAKAKFAEKAYLESTKAMPHYCRNNVTHQSTKGG